MAEKLMWCIIMYKILFYLNVFLYFGNKWINNDPTILNNSFHILVICGFLYLIEQQNRR